MCLRADTSLGFLYVFILLVGSASCTFFSLGLLKLSVFSATATNRNIYDNRNKKDIAPHITHIPNKWVGKHSHWWRDRDIGQIEWIANDTFYHAHTVCRTLVDGKIEREEEHELRVGFMFVCVYSNFSFHLISLVIFVFCTQISIIPVVKGRKQHVGQYLSNLTRILVSIYQFHTFHKMSSLHANRCVSLATHHYHVYHVQLDIVLFALKLIQSLKYQRKKILWSWIDWTNKSD